MSGSLGKRSRENSPDEQNKKSRLGACSVCEEEFKINGQMKKVDCTYCSFSSCRGYVFKYLLSKHGQERAHCMSCKRVWNTLFLSTRFSKEEQKGKLKEVTSNMLFERQKILFPETLPKAIALRNIRQTDTDALIKLVKKIENEKILLGDQMTNLNQNIFKTQTEIMSFK